MDTQCSTVHFCAVGFVNFAAYFVALFKLMVNLAPRFCGSATSV